MPYESRRFREHRLVRLPVLDSLIGFGWLREQIVCPSPDSDDTEWRVPKTPSEAAKRERGGKFEGFPCDIAVFDSPDNVGDWEHIEIIVEAKAPEVDVGISELETYLGLEPHARLGIWTNGAEFVRVYKLPDGGFEVERSSSLPKPRENLIRAGKDMIDYSDLEVPTEARLRSTFATILGSIAAADSVSTRPEQRLNEICNILMVKLESDSFGAMMPFEELGFQLCDSPRETKRNIDGLFRDYKEKHPGLFGSDDQNEIRFDEDSVQKIVLELERLNLKRMEPAALSMAFQVFRSANLKIGDGQYFTPWRVIEAGVKMIRVTPRDKVIDPACGTGGFISAAYMAVLGSCTRDDQRIEARAWAQRNLYGVDRDEINVKLTRALMVGIGDGSTNAYVGDSIRETRWRGLYPELLGAMEEGSYTVVLTNPPFGIDLRVSSRDARANGYDVCRHTPRGERSSDYCETELGIVFVERAWRLLREGGRLGIVLPETYFFSKSYIWFREWLRDRFVLRGVLNIPMEAFQGFCRAKTNFYVLEKKVAGRASGAVCPDWFRDGAVWVSYAPTIGINKDGLELHKVDSRGKRLPEIDDVATQDVEALLAGRSTETSRFVEDSARSEYRGVPQYSDDSSIRRFETFLKGRLPGFDARTLGSLIDGGKLVVRTGHGSPSADLRIGSVPYIKVSDLRAGLVNPNRTNMVSRGVAESFWRGESSGLKPFDIITPSRASKNIGEPTMLLPDQTDVVLTKEMLVFSVTDKAPFDAFYLMWALDLDVVLAQWKRVVFMQTNREDLGDRYREILIPYPADAAAAIEVSGHYRSYYSELAEMRQAFSAERARQNEGRGRLSGDGCGRGE